MSEELRNKIKSVKPFSEGKGSLILAQAGEAMNREIHVRMKQLTGLYPKTPFFTLSIPESLIWARYAKREKYFFELSLDYFIKGNELIFKEIERFSWRFGPEKLETVLRSWKTLLNELEISKMLQSFSPKNLSIFQQYSLNKAVNLSKIRKIPQIGAWIFCGPFKILVAYRKDIWNNPQLDDIWMPLGFQVVRGLRFLQQTGWNVPLELLYEEEPNLLEGMGTVAIAQNFQKSLANLAKSRVLHINSGLFKLGEEKRKESS